MVEPTQSAKHPQPTWLACKMVAYAVSFLAFILVGVPTAFHYLGEFVYPDVWGQWLDRVPALRDLGVVLFVVGIVGYLISSLWLVIVGKGPFVEFDPPTEFVATGPYRWMRNPIAAMLLLTILGEAAFWHSPGILTLFLLGFPIAQLQVTRIEEPRLKARFGESYLEYCRNVPRWLPKRPKREPTASS
ncbi:MAG: isoprenylcysteine carboxylmethyltransferase family protein [Planctomycetota bacterium]